jgi:hypothetical protein
MSDDAMLEAVASGFLYIHKTEEGDWEEIDLPAQTVLNIVTTFLIVTTTGPNAMSLDQVMKALAAHSERNK